MKLDSYSMNEAFKNKDWAAASSILLQYFGIEGCRSFDPLIDTLTGNSNHAPDKVRELWGPQAIVLFYKGRRYEWNAASGFNKESIAVTLPYFIIKQ